MTSKPKKAVDPKTYWQHPDDREIVSEAGRQWREENAEAIKGWSEYIEKNGLPLAKYRPI